MTISISSLLAAQIPTGMWDVMFWAALLSFILLVSISLYKFNSRFRNFASRRFTQIRETLFPPRKLAQLNKVVCYYCEKGQGLYDPVYRMIHNEPHVEGKCSHCGRHITVRLRG